MHVSGGVRVKQTPGAGEVLSYFENVETALPILVHETEPCILLRCASVSALRVERDVHVTALSVPWHSVGKGITFEVYTHTKHYPLAFYI